MTAPVDVTYTPSLDLAVRILSAIGWPVFLTVVWKFRGLLSDFLNRAVIVDARTEDIRKQIADVKKTTDEIAGNHLEHMERSLADQTPLLQSIERGIAILVDRQKQ